MTPPHRAWAHIDLSALTTNLQSLQGSLPPGVDIIPVVKGNAYGHGMAVVSAHLVSLGFSTLAVATVAEAQQLRAVCPTTTLMVLGPLFPFELPQLHALGAIPTLSSWEELHTLSSFCSAHQASFSVQLHIDTGLGREGIWHAEALPLAQAITASPYLTLIGLSSHLAEGTCASFTDLQRRRFLATAQSLPMRPRYLHLDASDGTDSLCYDALSSSSPGSSCAPITAVRIGRAMYGIPPMSTPGSAHRLQPVLSLHARIGLTKSMPAGATLGYNRTHTLSRPSLIAIVAAGYLDGVPTPLSNLGQALVHGQLVPIVGRVSMDMLALDVTSVPGVQPGSIVTFVGTQGAHTLTLGQLAATAGLIPWEVLGLVTSRVPRIYSSAPAILPRTPPVASHTISA